ncbi:hypothetical protein GP486_005854 [Trichoglossum hirsutum]|uniref:Biogenesis of lysosome-related organelles complex 1 subunit KXD1 n=1 Tax=Trichoglossum hirsutum TaxID=265104 RepID=A0A9P8RLG7_9PEZI|nr:hypothetical protein GP486_005854 [Trichoglossum hirsutum]
MSSNQAYYATSPLPINMASKSPYYTAHHHQQYQHGTLSPPEAPASATTSGVPSYSNSTSSSDYAASATGEYDSSSPAAGGVDFAALLSDRLTSAFDPIPLDRNLATQAQTSGALNAKHRELLELQAEAQRRLAATRAKFAEGMKAAKEVKRDLEWTQKRVT